MSESGDRWPDYSLADAGTGRKSTWMSDLGSLEKENCSDWPSWSRSRDWRPAVAAEPLGLEGSRIAVVAAGVAAAGDPYYCGY